MKIIVTLIMAYIYVLAVKLGVYNSPLVSHHEALFAEWTRIYHGYHLACMISLYF